MMQYLIVIYYFSSSHPQERKGGKGKAEPLKPIFLLISGMDEIEKVIKNSLFHPLFPHFPSISPSFSPLRQGKKSNLITELYNLFDF